MASNPGMTRCEFCNVDLMNENEIKRHILTVAHMRNKRGCEIVKEKYIERNLASTRQPSTLAKLLSLMQLNEPEHVDALMDSDFFDIRSDDMASVVTQLAQVLSSELVQYHIKKLPLEMRKLFQEKLLEEDERQRSGNDVGQNDHVC